MHAAIGEEAKREYRGFNIAVLHGYLSPGLPYIGGLNHILSVRQLEAIKRTDKSRGFINSGYPYC